MFKVIFYFLKRKRENFLKDGFDKITMFMQFMFDYILAFKEISKEEKEQFVK